VAKKKDTAVFKRPIPQGEARKTRYVVGIDLGTTNTALSYVDRRSGRKARDVRTFDVPQLSEPGLVEELRTLPSSIYVRGEHELSDDQVKLPWDGPTNLLVGELARRRGTVTPDRLISSAKSWLCHDGVDRKGQILPWGGPEDVQKKSPIEVEALILRHLRDAWNHVIADGDSTKKIEEQSVVVTIPASFDEVARELTVTACRQAGLRVLLIEEPQAALYAWIAAHEETWKETLSVGETVLVCDVGGGTTDFSLIQVTEDEDGEPSFERSAVGDHLLLGGDNMDLALARQVEAKLNKSLDAQAWQGLVQGCREAKIRLLSGEKDTVQLAITKRSSKLIGGTIKATIAAGDVVQAILDGFFPQIAVDAPAQPRARSGLKEFGLPFESDPAITRHLRDFLKRHANEAGTIATKAGLARVDHVLFNGGVFKTEALRERVLDTLGKWQKRPQELKGSDLDLAVARGAAYYGLVRRGRGTRIKSGAGRAYYLEVGTRGKGRSALCLIPRGIEEGKVVTISDLDLVLKANRPVVFPFHTSTVRDDEEAAIVELDDPEEFEELSPLHTLIRLGKKRGTKTKDIPVELVARYTEIGTLEIWAAAKEGEKRWRLELDTRPRAEGTDPGQKTQQTETLEGSGPTQRDTTPTGGLVIDPKKVEAAQRKLQEVIQLPASHGQRALERLGKELEEILGVAREGWSVPVIRALFDALLDVREARKRSPAHESRWLNLAGFCLRPGFGATLDDFRINEIWKVHLEGMYNPKRDAVRLEWAVCFRRIAGGFSRGQQETIFSPMQPFLLGRKRGASRQLLAEYWRLGASLEHLTPKKKKTLGDLMITQLEAGKAPPRWGPWALGRLGGRVPIHGPMDRLVSAEVAGGWLERLIRCKIKGREATFAAVQLARLTDDRTRNVTEAQREKAKVYLKNLKVEAHTLRPLEEVVVSEVRTEQEFYGDSVPMGLTLKA